MEECKWIMVRQETTREKIKRYLKNWFFRLIGLDECESEEKTPAKQITSKRRKQIIIEIIT